MSVRQRYAPGVWTQAFGAGQFIDAHNIPWYPTNTLQELPAKPRQGVRAAGPLPGPS
jgi:hypothetical protein